MCRHPSAASPIAPYSAAPGDSMYCHPQESASGYPLSQAVKADISLEMYNNRIRMIPALTQLLGP